MTAILMTKQNKATPPAGCYVMDIDVKDVE